MSDVRASDRLTDSAVCLVASEHGPDRSLEKLLQGSGRVVSAQKPILEINPRHSLVTALAELGDDENSFKEDAAHLLYDEARVLDGERPSDAKSFSDRLARLITRGLGKSRPFSRPEPATSIAQQLGSCARLSIARHRMKPLPDFRRTVCALTSAWMLVEASEATPTNVRQMRDERTRGFARLKSARKSASLARSAVCAIST